MLHKLFTSLKLNAVIRSYHLLSVGERRKLGLVILVQVFLSSLDLLGVIAIGLLGAISLTSLTSGIIGDRVHSILTMLHLENVSFEYQAIILGVGAVVLLICKTILSVYFTRKILFFLSRRGARISSELISRLLAQPLSLIQARTTQEILYAVTTGVSITLLQILATATIMVSDLWLLLIMSVGLFIVDFKLAIETFIVFFLIGLLIDRLTRIRAGKLGKEIANLYVKSNEKIVEVFESYRESVVRNRRDFYVRNIESARVALADTYAEMSFLPYISKYAIETGIVVSAILLGSIQLILKDATHAIATLSIFLVAGSRIAPAVLRIQQSMTTIQTASGQALPTLDLVDSLRAIRISKSMESPIDFAHPGFLPEIKISNISFAYPGSRNRAISNISLNFPIGALVAVVGPSGAGKSTLIDLLLGVLIVDEGEVLISGMPPLTAVAKWSGAVSYVPQDVFIIDGTVRENISLGYSDTEIDNELVMSAIKIAHLDEFVSQLPDGIHTQVGERGKKISGGQRQRLGIARALYTCPHILVLDEATSSLDGMTESSISESIHSLRGHTTIVMIAHRLSTVRNADIVVYLSEGKVLATGSFEEVRMAVPDFDEQAKIMGL